LTAQRYIRKGRKYTPNEILFHVISLCGNRKRKIDFDGDMIKITSDRLVAFKRSLECAGCGIKGMFFVKERGYSQKTFHFNLYAVKNCGEEVLMTKDHIVPKAKGGRNHPSNYQTMCRRCNEEKKDDVADLKSS
jgi:5-methylcytosine-specific restriction endonuclease McrA